MSNFLEVLKSMKWGDWLYTLVAAAISAVGQTLVANPLASILGAPQFTPRQLMIMAGAAALIAVGAVLTKSPLPDREAPRAVAVALLSGIRTPDEVKTVLEATAPGTVPTPEVAAAILGKPSPAPATTGGAA